MRRSEALQRFLAEARESLVCRLGLLDDDERILRQILENRFDTGLDPRRERLRAGRQRAAQQRIERLVGGARVGALLLGALANLGAALDHEIAVELDLAWRRQRHRAEPLLRALARRVEVADRFDLVAGELDAHRARALRREDVHDAAAHRHFAAFLDERHPRIARSDQLGDERIAIDPLADVELRRPRPQRFARGNPQRQRGERRDDDEPLVAGSALARRFEPAVEHVHPLRRDERLRREAVVGERVGMRKRADLAALFGRGFAEHHAQILEQRIGGLRIGRQEQHRFRRDGAHQRRTRPRARRAAQPRESHDAVAREHARAQVVEALRRVTTGRMVQQATRRLHGRHPERETQHGPGPPRTGVGRGRARV